MFRVRVASGQNEREFQRKFQGVLGKQMENGVKKNKKTRVTQISNVKKGSKQDTNFLPSHPFLFVAGVRFTFGSIYRLRRGGR